MLVSEIDWSDVLGDRDPEIAYNEFHSKYSILYEECFPWKKGPINIKIFHFPHSLLEVY